MAFIARRLTRHPLQLQHLRLNLTALSLEPRTLFTTVRQQPASKAPNCSRCYGSKSTAKTLAEPAPRQNVHGKAMTVWTQEMEETLLELKAQGKNWSEISRVVGASPSVCSIHYDKYLDPALKDWTEDKMVKLDSLAEQGLSWAQIGAKLGASARQCKHIWQRRGKGQYKFRAILNVPNTEHWTTQEVEAFWLAWFVHGQNCFRAAADDMDGRNNATCHKSILYFVKKAVEKAPGWAQIEILHFVSQAINNARGRAVVINTNVESQGDQGSSASSITAIAPKWTPQEHEALFKAVEKHGLFANWDEIRDAVKPTLKSEEVKKEYWRLSGMAGDQDSSDSDPKRSNSSNIRTDKYDSLNWSNEEVEALNLMLMKYGTMRSWQQLAEEKGVKPSPLEDLQSLFGGKTIPNTKSGSRDARDDEDDSPALWDVILRDRLRFLIEYQYQRAKAPFGTEGVIDWNWTADHIGPGVTADDCKTQWSIIDHTRTLLSLKKPPQAWSDEELHTLVTAVKTLGKRWVKIRSDFLPHRSIDSIRRKFRLLMDSRKHVLEEPIIREYQDEPALLEQQLQELEATNEEYALIRQLERALSKQ
ncbi:hypothetical protein BGW41_005425 [Actinomortierella wolfii]|nr:hypothetical protein BGW41_005425 [Actinomortierella wolfii]